MNSRNEYCFNENRDVLFYTADGDDPNDFPVAWDIDTSDGTLEIYWKSSETCAYWLQALGSNKLRLIPHHGTEDCETIMFERM